MTTETIDYTQGQPVVRIDSIGTTFGYYRSFFNRGNQVRIMFASVPEDAGGIVYSGSVDEVRPATEEEIKEYTE